MDTASAGIQHHAVPDGPEHGQIFQAHLGRPVFADGDPGVGPAKLQVGLGVLAHADLVEGPGKEGREGGDKGDLAPGGQTQPGAHHVLLGDVHFEKRFG